MSSVFQKQRICIRLGAFLGLSLLFVTGCHSTMPGPGDGASFLAERPHQVHAQVDPPEGFWAKAAKLILPDTDTPIKPTQQQTSSPQDSIFFNPANYQLASSASRFGHTATAPSGNLIRPHSLFGLAQYPPQGHFGYGYGLNMPTATMHDTETAVAEAEQDDTRDFLQARPGDSEAFRRLLSEIESTPPGRWKIDAEELEKRLTAFRNAAEQESNVQFESLYLMHLRKNILPERTMTAKKNSKTGRRRPIEEDDFEIRQVSYNDPLDESSEFEDEDDDRLHSPAPLPAPKPLLVKRSQKRRTDSELEEKNSALPLPSKPKYGQLAQLEEPSPIVQVRYEESRPAAPSQESGTPKEEEAGDWKSQLRRSTELLRREMEQSPQARTFGNEGTLRLLELAAGSRGEAVRPFPEADKSFNSFWSGQMLGLSSLLDEAGTPDVRMRYAAAAFRLDESLMELRQLCPMRLRNVQLVRDWAGFGVFLPRNEDCEPGEVIGLYMELENPTLRQSSYGYNVRNSVNYEIRDTAANIVFKKENIPAEQTTPTRTRDNCVHLSVEIPTSLPAGRYQLRISVTDMNSDNLQYAEEQIPIRVVPSRSHEEAR